MIGPVLPPYVPVELLHQGAAFTLERARDARDDSRVVLKRLAPERSSPGEQARLRREHEILRGLDLPGVPEARALIDEGGALTLVLADFGGVNLASWLEAAPRSLLARVEVAIRLAEVIGSLNAAIFESHGAEGPASAGAALGRGDTGRAS